MSQPARLVVIAGVYFLIIFTASTAYNSILTKIFEEEQETKLAPFIFIFNFGTFMVANLFAPLLKFPEKWLMAVASLCYGLNYLMGFFMFGDNEGLKYVLAAIGAAVAGLSASFLWVSIGRYIHKACHFDQRENEKGHYFGMFNSIYFFNSVLGGIVVTFGLKIMSHQHYFILVSCIAVLAFVFGAFFIRDIKDEEQETTEEKVKLTWKHVLLSTLKFYPAMSSLLGLIFIDGINIGIQSSTIIRLITKTDDKGHDDLLSGIAITCFGVGCLVGGYAGGKLCDRFQLKRVAMVGVLLFGLSCLTILAASFISWYPLTLGVFLFYGFQYSFITGCELVICSRTFKGAPESFAIVKQFHCLVFVVYEVIVLLTDNSIPLEYMMPVLFCFALPAWMGLLRLPS